jgi:hypothetical protein
MKKLLFITLMMLGVGSLHAQNNQGGSDIEDFEVKKGAELLISN